jgi:SNF2 family DNA or RNA helicase
VHTTLQWFVKQYDHGLNAILADEMGLGKTLMTIAFLVSIASNASSRQWITGANFVL